MRTFVLVILAGCAPPDPNDLFVQVDVRIEEGEADAGAVFQERVDAAEESLYVALPGAGNAELADTIVDAYNRNVEVEVLTDFDLATTDAISRLTAADVPVALRDGPLTYFEFTNNADISWPSSQIYMSNSWVVQDRTNIVFADRIGTGDDGLRVLFEMRGEDVVDDLLREHNQLYGGTDATAVDAYDAPAKSILDTRWRYATTTDVDMEIWFGPQERLLKRVIDGVYSARASVWILTDHFASEGLAEALNEKASWGFDVQVVVGRNFQDGTRPPCTDVPGADVSCLDFQNREEELARALLAAQEVPVRRVTEYEDVPTIVLLDYEDDSAGYRPRSEVMVLTHDMVSAARTYRGEPVVTDQLIDGTMIVLTDVSEPSPPMLQLEELFRRHYDLSEPL